MPPSQRAVLRSERSGVDHPSADRMTPSRPPLAARYLAETRDFNGKVNFIFQPLEE
jgi:hypothetical protein